MIQAVYFKEKEFRCKCCGIAIMDQDFIGKLDDARRRAGIPFVVMSGYRCIKHNRACGGVEDSEHTKGMAADIRCATGMQRYLIATSALAAGFTRIGIGKDFVHLGTDPVKPSEVMWTYYA
ncbi:MAG: D-Ala-D-Ala carboxypeptidase family metallohydrolase [Syntrophobacteraceae bacterium]